MSEGLLHERGCSELGRAQPLDDRGRAFLETALASAGNQDLFDLRVLDPRPRSVSMRAPRTASASADASSGRLQRARVELP